MSKLRLSMVCGDYDITRALLDGTVMPDGVDWAPLSLSAPERHWRMMRHEEFDVSEFSFSSYLLAREMGKRYIAIPAWPHRRFRHSYVFYREGSGIKEPSDLNGRRVGLDTLQNTAGLWMRGILHDHYGVDLKQIRWFTESEEDIPFDPPRDFRVERIAQGRDVDSMLLDGELDAALFPEPPGSFKKGSPLIRRLFENFREEEMRYYRNTKIFPIMHTVVIKEDILAQHPWVAMNVLKAFRQSLEISYARAKNPRRSTLIWAQAFLEEQERFMGEDPWKFNFRDNVHTIETAIRYAYETGMIKTKPIPEALFFRSTVEEADHFIENEAQPKAA